MHYAPLSSTSTAWRRRSEPMRSSMHSGPASPSPSRQRLQGDGLYRHCPGGNTAAPTGLKVYSTPAARNVQKFLMRNHPALRHEAAQSLSRLAGAKPTSLSTLPSVGFHPSPRTLAISTSFKSATQSVFLLQPLYRQSTAIARLYWL